MILRSELRGAPVSPEGETRLSQRGESILKDLGFFTEISDYYVWMRQKRGGSGYAHYYLRRCWNDSKMINEADPLVYQQLVDIDTKLGKQFSEQLLWCLLNTSRWDIIKVSEKYQA